MIKKGRLVLLTFITLLLLIMPISIKASSNVLNISNTEFKAARDMEFTTTVFVEEGSNVTGLVITLTYDKELVTLENYNKLNASEVNVNDNEILIVYSGASNVENKLNLVELTFKVDEQIGEGKYNNWLSWSKAEDDEAFTTTSIVGGTPNYTDLDVQTSFTTLFIRPMGDVFDNKGDGKVNARDAAMILQHAAKMIKLDEVEQAYANVYEDYNNDGSPKINARDAAMILQYAAKMGVVLSHRYEIAFNVLNDTNEYIEYTKKSIKEGEVLTSIPSVNKEGYEVKWSLSDKEYQEVDFSKINTNTNIYAYYEKLHVHTVVIDARVEPTCTTTGLTEGSHCETCGEVIVKQEVVEALGHDKVSHEAQAPTCTEIGWDAYETCSRCDYTTYVEKAALGHDKVSHEAQAPTCTEIGWDAYETCTRCDYTTYVEKAALGHSWNATEYTWSEDYSSCTASRECTREGCGTEENETASSNCIQKVTPSCGITLSEKYEVEFTNSWAGTTEGYKTIEPTGRHTYGSSNGGIAFCSVCNKVIGELNVSDGVLDSYNNTTENAIIPSGVTTIASEAFNYDVKEKIHTIELPSTITTIQPGALADFSNLTEIIVDENNPNYTSIDGVLYSKDGKTLVQFPGGKSNENYDIPATVTNIGEKAFYGCSQLSSVTIPETVKVVGDSAFSSSGLTTLVISNGVESIGKEAFEFNKITSVTIPGTVKVVGESAFEYCTSLATLIIEEGVEKIESYAFFSTKLQNITLPTTITEFGNNVFGLIGESSKNIVINGKDTDTNVGDLLKSCSFSGNIILTINGVKNISANEFIGNKNLISVTLPHVTSIGESAFDSCSYLEQMTMNEVKEIGNYAFSYCSKLNSIDMPKVTTIGESAFVGCSVLEQMTMNEVKEIGEYAFKDCSSLNSITFSKIESIGAYAFKNCSNLSQVDMPTSLIYIGPSAFENCANNLTVNYSGIEEQWNSITKGENPVKGIITLIVKDTFEVNNGVLTKYNGISESTITIPSTVNTIGDGVFAGNTIIYQVNLPTSVTSIGANAFNGCTNLQVINLPTSVTSIGENAFVGCNESIQIHYEGTEDDWTSNPITLGTNALGGFTPIYQKPESPFIMDNDGVTLIGYTGYASEITIPAEVKYIGANAFEGKTNITKVILHNNILSIGEKAFYGCTSLGSIEMSTAVTSIGNSAFENCTNLLSITIPNSVTTLGTNVLRNCYALTEITISTIGTGTVIPYFTYLFGDSSQSGDEANIVKDAAGNISIDFNDISTMPDCLNVVTVTSTTLTTITENAFRGSWSKKIVLPSSVTEIGKSSFNRCKRLEEINLSSLTKLTLIKEWAFQDCDSLKSIVIPTSENSIQIEEAAFAMCDGLTSIVISSSVTKIGKGILVHSINLENITIPTIGDSVIPYFTYLFEYKDASDTYKKDNSVYGFNNNQAIYITEYDMPSCLEIVTISGNITSISDYAFRLCWAKEIVLPTSVTTIGYCAFNRCKLLESINLDNVTSIAEWAFQDCDSLESIKLPKLTEIAKNTFAYCDKLSSLDVSINLTKIEGSAFDKGENNVRENLTINYEGTASQWNNVTFNNKPSDLIVNCLVA